MSVSELDFEEEFADEEELEDAINSLVVTVAEAVSADEQRTSVLNPIKLQHIHFTYKTLKFLTKGTGATVSYALHQPYNSTGFVSVVTDAMFFRPTAWLLKIADLASNIEAYPLTNGKVQINFTFHGLTKPIE